MSATSSRIFANVWRKIHESFAKVDGPPCQFPDMRPTELELRKRASRATLELKGCDFRAGAAEAYFVYYFCISFDFRGCGSLVHVLLSYWKVARHSSRAAEVYFATFVLKSCGFRAGAAKVHFVYYFCDECSENSPAKVPRWGPRKLIFFSRRWRFPEQGISDNCHVYTYLHT